MQFLTGVRDLSDHVQSDMRLKDCIWNDSTVPKEIMKNIERPVFFEYNSSGICRY